MKLYLVNSDNWNGTIMTEAAYKEATLQMGTGDFHVHSAVPFLMGAVDDETEIWDLDIASGEIMREGDLRTLNSDRAAAERKLKNPRSLYSGCRWYPRLGVYKGSHFYFDPNNLYATSYGWFPILMLIGQRLVLNECRYSNQTSKDYSRLHSAMRYEGIKADCSIYAPQGLHNLSDSFDYYVRVIADLENQIKTPRSHKRKNLERRKEIRRLKRKLKLVKSLMRVQKAKETREIRLMRYA